MLFIFGKIRILEKKFQVPQTADIKNKNNYIGLLRKTDDKVFRVESEDFE